MRLLAKFVGKQVVVSLKPNARSFVARSMNGKLGPVMTAQAGPDGKEVPGTQAPLALPFLIGIAIEADAGGLLVEYNERDVLGPPGDPTQKYQTFVVADSIDTVTVALEKSLIVGG